LFPYAKRVEETYGGARSPFPFSPVCCFRSYGAEEGEHVNTKSLLAAIALAILVLCVVTPATGQTGQNLVVNGSFEANPCTSDTFGQKLGLVDNAVTGWFIPASDGTYPWCLQNVNIYTAGPTPYGNQWLVLGEVGTGVPYTIRQTLTGLPPGNTYKLSFAIASESGCCSVAEVSFPSGSSTPAQDFTAPASGKYWTAWATETMDFTATNSAEILFPAAIGIWDR
jgi:hypothetical protein